jgi:hypothetical protein
MANVFAIHSVGHSIVAFLRNTYPAQIGGQNMPGCDFELVSSGQLAGDVDDTTRITLHLHRITVNEHLRRESRKPTKSLSLDLHYLMTAWAGNPLDEQVAMTWAMRQLFLYPQLDVSALSPDGGWGRGDVVQIMPSELDNEEMMRIWDALDPAYRLSVSYVARVVNVDPDTDTAEYAPAVARRLTVGEEAYP